MYRDIDFDASKPELFNVFACKMACAWRVPGVCLGVLGVCLGCAWGVPGRALDEVKSPKMWNGRSTPRGSHKGLLGTLLGLILACLGAFWNSFSVVLGPSWGHFWAK